MSDTGAEASKPDPHCSWKSHSRRVGVGVADENTESGNAVLLLRIPSVIRPEHCTSVAVVR